MTTPHVIASSSSHPSHASGSNGLVGNNGYRVGKKIGEGSFGVVFEGELLTRYVLATGQCARRFD